MLRTTLLQKLFYADARNAFDEVCPPLQAHQKPARQAPPLPRALAWTAPALPIKAQAGRTA
jgi:hypothetical protein